MKCDQGNYSVYKQSFSVNILFAYIVSPPQDRLFTTYVLSWMPPK